MSDIAAGQATITPPEAGAERYSKADLTNPSRSVSADLSRPFFQKTHFDSEKELDAAIESAKKALPEVPSAYIPSGKTTASATIAMLLATPVVLLLLVAICGGLCLGWALLLGDGTDAPSRGVGFISIILNIILVVLMIWIPVAAYGAISRVLKNRNPKVPAILAGISTFITGIILFAPIIKGATLAPTDLTLLFIPIRWVLIVGGMAVAPLLAAVAVHAKISSQKFCEGTGCYLSATARVPIAFDFAENALELLKRGEYEAAINLQRADAETVKRKHVSEIIVWSHDRATTAFIEMEPKFHGTSKPLKTMTMEERKDKQTEWLAFSALVDKSRAEQLRGYAAQTMRT